MLMPATDLDLPRVLEPEVMDTERDAEEYRAIDNREVNRIFVEQALALAPARGVILDVGAGPGAIAIELARASALDVVAIDLAEHMLAIARADVLRERLSARVTIARVDAKATGFPSASFDAVVSNSLVHHVPDPVALFAEIARLVRPGGAIFIKDLLRPRSARELAGLVARHASNDTPYQRELFAASLHAALRTDEVERACREAGLRGARVRQVSDRHWTIERRAEPAEGEAP